MPFFSGWDRLHGSDQGCPRKSDSWDMLQHCTTSNSNDAQDHVQDQDDNSCMGPRVLSVSSDSRLLEDEIKQEVKVILRPKKPPRPQSEVFLDQVDKRRTKRYSAFGVSWEKKAQCENSKTFLPLLFHFKVVKEKFVKLAFKRNAQQMLIGFTRKCKKCVLWFHGNFVKL